MAYARTMALWLVAVIVLIAVGVMPSGAQAHAGHAHPAAALAPLPAAIVSTAIGNGTKADATALVTRAGTETSLARACDGACCRTAGASCCTGTALAPDTHAALNGRRPTERALARALPARTDVVPEALPEPPRSFA